MNQPVFHKSSHHPAVPIVELWCGNELVMKKDDCQLAVFLHPAQALLLAEGLIQQARKALEQQK